MPYPAVTPPAACIYGSGHHDYGVGDPVDGPGLGAVGVVEGDPPGVAASVGEWVGVGERVGVREGLGDSVGLGAERVGLAVPEGFTVCWVAPAGATGTGRTRM
jgi:hypothetical protein